MKKQLSAIFAFSLLLIGAAFAQAPNTTRPPTTMIVTPCLANVPLVGAGATTPPVCWVTGALATIAGSGSASDLGTGTLPDARLANVITAAGPIGSATVVPIITFDAHGRLTAVTSATIAAVTSVGLSLPSFLTVSGSPVTTTGTLTGTLATQSANFVFVGPTSGGAAAPTFRALVGADLPNPGASSLGGIQSYAAVSNQFLTSISTLGVVSSAQPAFTNLSGSASCAQLPALTGDATTSACALTLANSGVTANTYGSATQVPQIAVDVKGRITGVTNVTITPAFASLTGSAACSQLPALTGDVTTSAGACATTIATGAVTYAKIQNISATQRALGRNTAGAGVTEEVTATQLLDWLGSTRGSILYRGASGWAIAAPSTAGTVWTSNGAGADPTYQAVGGTGTVTSVATNNGLTGGTITTTGTIGLATIATGNMLANITGSTAVPVATAIPVLHSSSTSSSTTFVTPSTSTTATAYRIMVQGGGGGGGGYGGSGSAGSGGGAGAYCESTVTGIAASTTLTITINSGGTGGNTSGSNGTAGGSALISGTGLTTITAGGGGAGHGTTSGTTPQSGGLGGTCTNGTIQIAGQDGAASKNPTTAYAIGGDGGSSQLGRGGRAGAENISASGYPATGFGGGGGGGIQSGGSGGGLGTQGAVIIQWVL